MEIIEVYNTSLSVYYKGGTKVISFDISRGKSNKVNNSDYIVPGDLYYKDVIICNNREDPISNLLSKYIDGENLSDVTNRLLDYDEYCELSSLSHRYYKMADRLDYIKLNSITKITGVDKMKSFCYSWCTKVLFRQMKLLGENHFQYIFKNAYPDLNLVSLPITSENIYKMYWYKLTTIKRLEEILGIKRNKTLISLYKISRKLFTTYLYEGVISMSKREFGDEFASHFEDLSKVESIEEYGISRNGKRFLLSHISEKILELNSRLRTRSKTKSLKSKLFGDVDILATISKYESIIGNEFDEHQKTAILGVINSKEKTSSVTGMPGTGKSTIIGCILYILEYCTNLSIGLFTFAGKASSRLSSIIEKSRILKSRSSTCHMFFCSSNKKNGLFKPKEYYHLTDTVLDVVIFDESSMVSLDLVLTTIRGINVNRVIFIGDINQIPCVDSIDVFNSIIKNYTTYNLPTVHRNKFRDLNNDLLESHTLDSIFKYNELVIFKEIVTMSRVVKYYVTRILKQNINDRFKSLTEKYDLDSEFDTLSNIILTYRNETRIILNRMVRERLGYLDKYVVGEYMIILDNDYENGIMNGDTFIIVNIESNEVECYFPDHYKTVILSMKYIDSSFNGSKTKADYAYCLTYHKSEGSEWDNVLIYIDYLEKKEGYTTYKLNLNLLYTGINRTINKCYLYLQDSDFLDVYIDSATLNTFK